MYINLGNRDYRVQVEHSDIPIEPYVIDIDDGYSAIALYLDKAQLIELANGIMEFVDEEANQG